MLERFGIANRRELAVFVSLVLLVAVTPAGHEASHPAILGLYRTLLLSIIAAYAAWTDRSKLQRLCPYFVGAVTLTSAIMLITVLRWNGDSTEGFYTLYQNVLFITAFIALAHAGTARPARWKNAVLGAVVLIDVAYIAGSMMASVRPIIGPFVNPNYLASFVLPGLAICIAAVLLGTSTMLRLGAAAAAMFLYYGIGKTSSRGATLAGLALLGLAVFRAARRYGFSWLRMAIAGLLLIVVTITANPALVRKFLDRGERDPYNYQRTQIWLGTLSMIGQYPVLGVGLGHYYHVAKVFTPAVQGTIARYRKWPNIAHSEYLQYAAEIGVPGAVLLFGIGGYMLLLAWRRAPHVKPECSLAQEAAILTATGLAVHALVDNNWTVPVLAAGLAVISQADLLPFRKGPRIRLASPGWRPALALLLACVWIDSAFIPAVGLYFNEAGHEAYNAGDLQNAELHHRFALAFLPKHPVLLDNLGMVYMDEFVKTQKPEYLDRAEFLFSDSMKENSHFDIPAGHLETALIQRLTGNPKVDVGIHKKIIEADRRVLDANPFNPFIRKNLAEGLYNIGEREQACEELLRAIAMEPNYVPGYLRLADWYDEMGRHEEGGKYRNQAIQVVNLYKDKKTQDPFEDMLLGRPQAKR